MIRTFMQLLAAGNATSTQMFPDLPGYSRGLPAFSETPCDGCGACVDVCPTGAIAVTASSPAVVTLDRGRCLACGECVDACPSGTIVADRSTRVAARRREGLILTNSGPKTLPPPVSGEAAARLSNPGWVRRSLHFREVAAGDSAADMEIAAAGNPIFDSGRFGVHVVASPRHADALVVTGPVARPMREPLRRCYEAMAEPRVIVAAGAGAISGVPLDGGETEANGVDSVLPVDMYVPGHPPHPWYILHGLLLLMGRACE
ncbi:MAG: 4Fe-4S binding protein [Capsulimonadaceae bacterium]